jgi:hypothetical protein
MFRLTVPILSLVLLFCASSAIGRNVFYLFFWERAIRGGRLRDEASWRPEPNAGKTGFGTLRAFGPKSA